jgi:hypothetical protein
VLAVPPAIVSRAHGPLPQEAYVWQRAWRPAVVESARRADSSSLGLVVLAGEVAWRDGCPTVSWSAWDTATLARRRVGLALRIASRAGGLADEATVGAIAAIAADAVGRARAAGAEPIELQIDFDAGVRQLADYARWLGAIRAAIAPVAVTVTALPAWLAASDLDAVLAAADGWVLQVHGLVAPTSADAPFTLCDATIVGRAVERAARHGRPFRVALPTYGYRVLFDRTGRFVGFTAETAGGAIPEGGSAREIRADPTAIAAIVREWETSRPASLTGIVWYRLPVADDVRAWSWETFAAVMAGRAPAARVAATVDPVEPGLVEIALDNRGEADELPRIVRVPGAAGARARDGLGGFRWDATGERLTRDADDESGRLRPGERRVIGWLRFAEPREVRADVVAND